MITDISRASYVDYQEYKAALDAELQQSTESFVRIGYMLKIARDTDILQGSGYISVNEFARAEYNIDKTLVSRFISINDRFSEGGNSDRLQEQYRGFGYAKLAIMLQLPDAVNEEITPAFSKSDVQAIKDEVDAERQVTDIEVMLETKNEAQEEMESNLDKAIHQLGHDNPELYAELHAAIVGEEAGGPWSAIQETLAPSGEGIYSVRIMGIGRLLLSVKGIDRDITLTNVRTGEKENYTWEQMESAVDDIIRQHGTAKESYEAVYNETYPAEEKKEVAPVQPKTESPKKEKSKKPKVTKAPEPKKKEYAAPEIVPAEQEAERIASEDVEILETVENTMSEAESEKTFGERSETKPQMAELKRNLVLIEEYAQRGEYSAAEKAAEEVKSILRRMQKEG